MSAWSPQQAAEFKAAASVAFLRALAEDPKARLGLHRAAGIARAQGYVKVDVMGIRFSDLPVAAENNDADPEEPLRQEHAQEEQQGEGQDAQPTRAHHCYAGRVRGKRRTAGKSKFLADIATHIVFIFARTRQWRHAHAHGAEFFALGVYQAVGCGSRARFCAWPS